MGEREEKGEERERIRREVEQGGDDGEGGVVKSGRGRKDGFENVLAWD